MRSEGRRDIPRSRMEIESDGEVAYLEFDIDKAGWMTLWHTEVPRNMRGHGVAEQLAKSALEYARDNHLKVDVVCPIVAGYIERHPEYNDIVGT